jgi:NAD(P)-dependent dehydrogenase (short-subunit alcohol dehydrogenase family)
MKLGRSSSGPKTMLVTGAGAGIGRSITRRFATAGWRVAACDIDLAAVEALASELGANVVAYELDVVDPAGWQRVLGDFCGDGGLDLLVNNAGIVSPGYFVDVPLGAHLAAVDVNLKGVMTGCHTAYPYLRRGNSPQVVNLASASALYGQAELAGYSATKFGVRGLSEALDLEWSRDGIRVQAIWPLFVATAMTENMDIGTVNRMGVRLGPDDVAAAVWKAVNRPRMFDAVRSIHRPVGANTTVSMLATAVSPSWIQRHINGYLARR